MRVATFNLESLGAASKSQAPLETRIAVLQPALERLEADILCLQEVNAQHVRGQKPRALAALDRLLANTRYAGYHRAYTGTGEEHGPADVHNLVTLSRFPLSAAREIRHHHVGPLLHAFQSSDPPDPEPKPLRFDRPLLLTDLDTGDGNPLTVINLHLRAPLAANIPAQKLAPFVWRSVAGWAEGYFVSATLRSLQALELRLLVDTLQSAIPRRHIAVVGDFNAEDHETPLKIAIGSEEDTGNGMLSARSLVVLDRALPADRRWSVMHHGRPQMLDHILVSRDLYGRFRSFEVHNESLGDEAIGYAKVDKPAGSYHAPLVATFDLGTRSA